LNDGVKVANSKTTSRAQVVRGGGGGSGSSSSGGSSSSSSSSNRTSSSSTPPPSSSLPLQVQKWAVLPQEFSEKGGELTPTLKLKRKVAIEKYHDVIEKLYAGSG